MENEKWTSEEMKKTIHDMAWHLKKHSDDVNALKIAQEKMKAELNEKFEKQENQFVDVKASLERLTEEEEIASKSVYEELLGKSKDGVLSTLGYANAIDSALYRPKSYFNIAKGWIKSGSAYDVNNEIFLMNDFCYLFGMAKAIHMNLKGTPTTYEQVVKGFDTYQILKHELSMKPELRKALKAMDLTLNSDWVPTGMSAQLIDDIRLELRVANLFPTMTMPARSGSWDVPVQGSRMDAYLVAENTADTGQTKAKAGTPSTGKMTFTAVKHALRILWSYEFDEDSILAVMPFVRSEMIAALSGGWDNAIINGDITATHMDSDITTATDVEKSFRGLRKESGNSSGDAAVDISTLSTANLRSIRKAMGKYGVKDCAWITGISGFVQLLSLDEVITADKFGSAATILTGQMAALDGFPVVVSEFVREDLNASGVYDNATKTKTIILLANKKGFWNAQKPGGIMVESARDIENQQNIAVASHRLDFKKTHSPSSGALVGIGYNLTT